jgi:transposase
MTAPWAMIGKRFLACVERCLASTLKRNDIVMIDNLPAHRAAGVREAIEARGATLRFLPKYSPDLNPIEMSFSQMKAYLRTAGERTIPRLRCRIGSYARNLYRLEAARQKADAPKAGGKGSDGQIEIGAFVDGGRLGQPVVWYRRDIC